MKSIAYYDGQADDMELRPRRELPKLPRWLLVPEEQRGAARNFERTEGEMVVG